MSMADRIAVMDRGVVQQVAEPVVMYRQPVNAFVADFIGTGTLIHGLAASAGLRALGRTLPAHGSAPLDRPALIVLRPEDVTLSDETGIIAGSVIETHFFGGSTTTAIEVPGLPSPLLANRPGAPIHRAGDRVEITWRAEDALLLPGAS